MPYEHLERDVPTVCIVDDEASIRACLIDLFETAGMRAVAYENADDFLDCVDLSQAGLHSARQNRGGMVNVTPLMHRRQSHAAEETVKSVTAH